MGTATEQSLRNILTELESDTLPTDAATETTLALCLTALQLIDDLRNALASVAGDDIRVAPGTNPLTVQASGGDKVISFQSIVEQQVANTNLNAGANTLSGTAVPAGKTWLLTNVSIYYYGTSPTRISGYVEGLALGIVLINVLSPTSDFWYTWTGQVFLQAGDYVMAYVKGATAGDDFYLRYCGVQMDAPS